MEQRYNLQSPGSQEVLPIDLIGPPVYELHEWQYDETIEYLLAHAIDIGERHSLAMQAAGHGPTPYAHRGTGMYNAIQLIRLLEKQVKELRAKVVSP